MINIINTWYSVYSDLAIGDWGRQRMCFQLITCFLCFPTGFNWLETVCIFPLSGLVIGTVILPVFWRYWLEVNQVWFESKWLKKIGNHGKFWLNHWGSWCSYLPFSFDRFIFVIMIVLFCRLNLYYLMW